MSKVNEERINVLIIASKEEAEDRKWHKIKDKYINTKIKDNCEQIIRVCLVMR